MVSAARRMLLGQRECKHCRRPISQQELFRVHPTDSTGNAEAAQSLGMFWVSGNVGTQQIDSICDKRPAIEGDHHEPLDTPPELGDTEALQSWLED